MAALCLVACGDGLALDQTLGDDGGGTGATAGGLDSGGGGTGGGDDGSTNPNGDGSGGSGGGDPGSDGGGFDDPCQADCGPDGACVFDEDGAPTCECSGASVAYGMRCLPCVKTDSVADIALGRADLTLTVTVAGEPPPTSPYERARIWLRDRASGDEILAGETTESPLEVSVLPGTYDVMYDRIAGGAVLPRNHSAVLIHQLGVTDSAALDVDLPVVLVQGKLAVAGAAPPANPYESGDIVLVDRATGDEVLLGHTRDGSYSALVLPGDYEVHYRKTLGGSLVPLNGDAYFQDATVAPGNQEVPMQLDIDVPMVELGGSFLLDGDAAPTNDYENALISLRDPDTADEFPLGETKGGQFTAKVVPGTYEVVYSRKLGGATVPLNADAILDTLSVTDDDSGLAIDITTSHVSGSFTLDGGAVGAAPGEDAIVSLVDDQTGDEIPLGHVADGSFDRVVVAGSYTVSYGQLSAAGTLPANIGAQLMALKLDAGEVPDQGIDIATATVAGQILLGGATPPTSEYSDGRLYLRNTDSGDSVLLGNTRLGGYTGTVVPGTYDVVYVVETAGSDVPVNTESKLAEGVVVSGDAQLDIDIPVFDLVGAIAVGGEAPPDSDGDRAQLLLQDVATDDVVFLGGTQGGSFTQRLTGGTYVVLYEGVTSTGVMPANEHAGVACVVLGSQ